MAASASPTIDVDEVNGPRSSGMCRSGFAGRAGER